MLKCRISFYVAKNWLGGSRAGSRPVLAFYGRGGDEEL